MGSMRQTLPGWDALLVVVAHPDDETFGLGGVVARFSERGADVKILCFTHGEASTLGEGELRRVRSRELRRAAADLGANTVELLDLPDGHLADRPLEDLAELVEVRLDPVDGVLVFGPGGVTGHPDHIQATGAAVLAAEQQHTPVLGWVIPERVAKILNGELGTTFRGVTRPDLAIRVDRERHVRACRLHASQLNPVLWRRLELLRDEEWLVWMRTPEQT